MVTLSRLPDCDAMGKTLRSLDEQGVVHEEIFR